MKKYALLGVKVAGIVNILFWILVCLLAIFNPIDALVGTVFLEYAFYLPITYILSSYPILPPVLGTGTSIILIALIGLFQHMLIGALAGGLFGYIKEKIT